MREGAWAGKSSGQRICECTYICCQTNTQSTTQRKDCLTKKTTSKSNGTTNPRCYARRKIFRLGFTSMEHIASWTDRRLHTVYWSFIMPDCLLPTAWRLLPFSVSKRLFYLKFDNCIWQACPAWLQPKKKHPCMRTGKLWHDYVSLCLNTPDSWCVRACKRMFEI